MEKIEFPKSHITLPKYLVFNNNKNMSYAKKQELMSPKHAKQQSKHLLLRRPIVRCIKQRLKPIIINT